MAKQQSTLAVENVPRCFLGSTLVTIPRLFGLMRLRRPLGFDIQISDLTRSGETTVNLRGTYSVFSEPPIIQLTNSFNGELRLSDRAVTLVSDSDLFTIRGELSHDLQLLVAKVDIRNIGIMDVSGSFSNQDITLEAYVDDDD